MKAFGRIAIVLVVVCLLLMVSCKQPVYHSVIFESNGGTAVPAQSIEDGKCANQPANPIKDGCKFMGWFSDAALTLEYNFSTPVKSDLVLYAKWFSPEPPVKTTHTVNFQSLGGSDVEDQEVEDGQCATEPEDPTRRGYIFFGWYTGLPHQNQYDFSTPVTKDITLYAKWVKKSKKGYTVTYKDGQGNIYTTQVSAGSYSLMKNGDPSPAAKDLKAVSGEYTDFKAYGYSFGKWFVGGKSYWEEEEIEVTDNIEVESVWTKSVSKDEIIADTCSVVRKTDVDIGEVIVPRVYSDWSGKSAGDTPTNYEVVTIAKDAFKGSANVANVDIPKSVTAIEENAFSNCPKLQEVKIASDVPPTLGDNVFSGSANVVIYVPPEAEADYKSDPTWEQAKEKIEPEPLITFNVTYNANGATSGSVPIDAINHQPGEYVGVLGNSGDPALAKTGYVFAGWNTAPEGSGTAYQPGDQFEITWNVVLYAQWTEIVVVSNEAKIGSTEYATLAAAIEAAKDGQTITLLKDITPSTISIGTKRLTIDLANYKITAINPISISTGSLQLKGGNYKTTGSLVTFGGSGGYLTVTGNSYELGSFVGTLGENTISITGGTFDKDPSSYAISALVSGSGGSWTVNSSGYEIYISGTGDHLGGMTLSAFRDYVNSGTYYSGCTVMLLKDVDLSNGGTETWTEIGNKGRKADASAFQGVFDGSGHTVCNINCTNNTDDMCAGFIGTIYGADSGNKAIIKNLTVSGGTVTNTIDTAGGVVGCTLGYAAIENCHSAGLTITAGDAGGGIAGRLYGDNKSNTCNGCTNTSTVCSGGKAGGIVAILHNGCTISNCTNSGNIKSYDTAGIEYNAYGVIGGLGGIVGFVNSDCTITGCSNSGTVGERSEGTGNIESRYTGGIAGINQNGTNGITISSCSNTGSIKSFFAAGGAVGFAMTPLTVTSFTNSGTIDATYPVRSVTDQAGVPFPAAGGVLGKLFDNVTATLTSCTNIGTIKADAEHDEVGNYKAYAGGLVGYEVTNPTVTMSSCNGGNIDNITATGKTTTEAHKGVDVASRETSTTMN